VLAFNLTIFLILENVKTLPTIDNNKLIPHNEKKLATLAESGELRWYKTLTTSPFL
jgi:hypothetical protein